MHESIISTHHFCSQTKRKEYLMSQEEKSSCFLNNQGKRDNEYVFKAHESIEGWRWAVEKNNCIVHAGTALSFGEAQECAACLTASRQWERHCRTDACS